MFNFLKKGKNVVVEVTELSAIVNGTLVDIETVNDPTFSNKLMGDAVAFIPEDDTVVAPCDCTISVANENMKHALGLTLDNGIELIIHVGINTVDLNGEGFEQLITAGAKVKKGQSLLKFDSAFIKAKEIDDTIMMIVTNNVDHNLKFLRNGNSLKDKTVVIQLLK